jgi:hypothetical protein
MALILFFRSNLCYFSSAQKLKEQRADKNKCFENIKRARERERQYAEIP